MSGLVVVTRPREEAELLAAQLKRRGYETLIEPILEIVPRTAVLPPLAGYDGLVFTSANGARAFAALSDHRDLPAYAVGGQTAATLSALGFSDVRDGGGDALALSRMIAASLGKGRLLHLSGNAVARDLAELLAAEIVVERIELYAAVRVRRLTNNLVEALYACTVGSVLLFSPRTAAIYGTLIAEMGLTELHKSVSAVCLSPAVAIETAPQTWKEVAVASRPSTESLLAHFPPLNDRTSHGT